MKAFLYGVALQWRIDFRRKDVLMMYYLMPLVFFFFMGGIFTSIDSSMKQTLIYAMTIFAVCAGAFVGVPSSIIGFYGSNMKNVYRVGGIPLWTTMVNSFISAMLHLFLVSIIIAVLSPLVFGAEPVSEVFPYLIITLSFMLAAISIGMLLGLFIQSQARLSMVAMILFLVSIMLSGIMLPDQFLPEVLKSASEVLPSRWAFNAMIGNDVIENILPMLAVFFASTIISTIRLRKIGNE